ncbi:hypothetical protein HYPSUDRAFT_60320 [Hypholoma sublateritium FD-334 SS-4]|uniref:Uncharacterized protein n=1 Tax=Hypholoma sublateritium (strain FD-334 SS-4) TaxID=945553 RepID=A0A0D2KDL1_HYPSF|nr:hypothetical protein HYPSUDRAFT_60320 [Hypholoma sublateritium FD-334 SS-4]
MVCEPNGSIFTGAIWVALEKHEHQGGRSNMTRGKKARASPTGGVAFAVPLAPAVMRAHWEIYVRSAALVSILVRVVVLTVHACLNSPWAFPGAHLGEGGALQAERRPHPRARWERGYGVCVGTQF